MDEHDRYRRTLEMLGSAAMRGDSGSMRDYISIEKFTLLHVG